MFTEIKPRAIYPDAKHIDALEVGLEFQDFVCVALAKEGIILQNLSSRRYQQNTGENLQGFEIKLDNRWSDTGRLSIETAEKTSASRESFVRSGIYRQDNTWLYIQGNYKGIFIFAKNTLQGLHRRTDKPYETKEMPTIQTFYLPVADCIKYAAKSIWFCQITKQKFIPIRDLAETRIMKKN